MNIHKLLIFFMFAALVTRLFLCFQPPEVLISKVVSDDMFYYLAIARNITLGYGATADRENATNGFHPLWALILVPILKVFHPGSALQWALCLLTLFSVISAWFIYRIVRFSCGEIPSFLAAVIWLCCPYTVLVTLAGVEAPLFVLLLGAAAYYYLILRDEASTSLHRWAICGVLIGLTILARIDGAVFAALVCCDCLIHRRGWFVRVAVLAAACILVTLPWCVWSYLRTGFIFQMSGKAIYHQQHFLFWRQGGGVLAWCGMLFSNMRDAIRSVAVLDGLGFPAVAIIMALCAILVTVCAMRQLLLFSDWFRRTRRLGVIILYGPVMILLYSGYLWYSQDWYYYSIVFAGCIAAGCLFDLADEWLRHSLGRAQRNVLWGTLAAIVIVFSCGQATIWWGRGIRGWQIDTYNAALWVRDNLHAKSRIGSFNSGMLAYYCPQTVINLDGVVNGAAYKAVSEGKIFSYVREQGIDYIVESPLSLRFRSFQSANDSPPPLKPVHAEGSYPEAARRNNPVIVYEVIR